MTFNLNALQSLLLTVGLNLLWTIGILLVGYWAARLLRELLRKTLKRSGVDPSLIGFLETLTYYGLLFFVVIAALARLGIQTTSLVAVVGAAGLAVGLALQGSLANFAAGVLVLVFRPYRVGDVVEMAGAFGTVEEIQIFTTVLATPDNKVIVVPNARATEGNITNYTRKGTRRLDMVFGIGYDDDLLQAKQLLEQIIAADERILQEPAPTVAVLELADSSVNFAVRPYVRIEDYWHVLFDTTEKVKLLFDQEEISIPYPQQDVHLFRES